jgi:hypothetical protein
MQGAKGLDELRRERFRIQHDEASLLGFDGYIETISRISGIALRELGLQASRFLEATKDMYGDCLKELVHSRLGLSLSDLVRADVAWAFRADGYDAAFSGDCMLDVAHRQIGDMRLDASREGRVRFDTEERPGKHPRAFCVPVRVPEEVYLVLRPQGGHGDYRTFWHELGHAMHFASPSRELSFEARWLGDNSVTEGFAMLWDHLTFDPLWLETYADLNASEVRALGWECAINELYLVRRYAAKLLYELSLHDSGLEGLGPEYADRLSTATLFQYSEHDCLSDVDSGFYCARYLRAWQLEAVLSAYLRERFDEDWFRNPRAGSFFLEQMSLGQSQPAHELARSVAGVGLTFASLIERLEKALSQ